MIDVTSLLDCKSRYQLALFDENILVSEIAELPNTVSWAVLTGNILRAKRIYTLRQIVTDRHRIRIYRSSTIAKTA